MGQLPQQHNLADGCRADALSFLHMSQAHNSKARMHGGTFCTEHALSAAHVHSTHPLALELLQCKAPSTLLAPSMVHQACVVRA
eukprot:359491-Chlamydomonas_euryale.AAC.3